MFAAWISYQKGTAAMKRTSTDAAGKQAPLAQTPVAVSVIGQGDDCYAVDQSGVQIGLIKAMHNPYHNQHIYLNLELTRLDASAAQALFGRLRRELGKPLQVMLYASEEMHEFLTAGGFQRKRRCYEWEASSSDLCVPLTPSVCLQKAERGSLAYTQCCKLLYNYYGETHSAVSPLTIGAERFCSDLPDTAFCFTQGGTVRQCAFIEPDGKCCEIAYVGSLEPNAFSGFAHALLAELFGKYDVIAMECDDCDPAAMALKALFALAEETPYDTYILA